MRALISSAWIKPASPRLQWAGSGMMPSDVIKPISKAMTPSLWRIGLNQRRRIERGRRGETQARQGRGLRQEPPQTAFPGRRYLGSRLRGVAAADHAERDTLPRDGRREGGWLAPGRVDCSR